jgi:hypothetical protein
MPDNENELSRYEVQTSLTGKDISVSGKVVRLDSRGIEVKFNELLTTR